MSKPLIVGLLACVLFPALLWGQAASDNIVVVGDQAQPVQWVHQSSIQVAIVSAGPTGAVWIPNTYTGTDCNPIATCNPGTTLVIDLRGGAFKPTQEVLRSYTVAALPVASSSIAGTLVAVTDANVQGSCTVGGGVLLALCRSNGSSWQPIGDGGSGGGLLPDPGANGIVQRTALSTTAALPLGTTGTQVPLMWANAGTFNLMIGTGSGGVTNATGGNNVCLNASNLSCFYSLTSGNHNVSIGSSAGWTITTGTWNVAIGNGLGGSEATGSNNVAIGLNADNGTGDNSNVTAVGNGVLQHNQRDEAAGFGYQALQANTTGLNDAFGPLSLLNNTTGTANEAFGLDALRDNVSGNSNTAMGSNALQSNTANNNTAFGNVAGFTLTPANANVTGTNDTWIGYNTGPGSTTQNNYQSILGAGTQAVCNNCVVFGPDGQFGTEEIHAASPCETTFGITTLSGASTNTGLSCLPANSVIDAVLYRITTTITTAASFTIGDGTIAARFCAAQSTLTVGTTGICFAQADQTGTSGPRQVAAAVVKITPNTTPGAGALRLIVYYHTWVAPTS